MRHGKLMAEQNPRSLKHAMNCNTLEEVLLKLCLLQSSKEQSPISVVNEDPALSQISKVPQSIEPQLAFITRH